jgi:site-specific DNA-methyltransferase (adenine-specific)
MSPDNRPDLPLDQIIHGDCIEVLDSFPEKSIDLIFADPPYNLQLQKELWRPNLTRVDAVNDAWDQFSDLQAYDQFTHAWLSACHRVLKDSGSFWVIGSYHNIFRVGAIMQDLGFWFLNDIVWIKTNPMPNFRGVRFTNAHETLIWASKYKGSKYTFNHHAMKSLNNDLQMRSDWLLPICTGAERLKSDGKKAHSTQKPEALLYRAILASSNVDDVVLDPFFGTGTTGAVARKLHRHWIGIEAESDYIPLAQARIDAIIPEEGVHSFFDVRDERRRNKRIPFPALLEHGLILPGQKLYFRKDQQQAANVRSDGKLALDGFVGSIHQVGQQLSGGSPCNGWQHWYYMSKDNRLHPIDDLRQSLREQSK